MAKKTERLSLVEQLQAEALDRSVPTEDLLRKAKIVATKLDLPDFLAWIEKELGGYGPDESAPAYRMISGEVRGWNPYHGWMPIVWQDARERIRSSTQPLSQPIGEISDLVNRGSNQLAAPLGSAKLGFGSDFKMHTNIQLQIDRTALVGILDAVRNRVLDWSLKLEKEGITGSGMSFSKKEKEMAHEPTIISKINIKAERVSGVVGQVSGRAAVRGNQTHLTAIIDSHAAQQLTQQIRKHIGELDLPEKSLRAVVAEIDIIGGELAMGKPDQSRLRAAFTRTKEILIPVAENAAGNVIAVGILTAIHQLLGIP